MGSQTISECSEECLAATGCVAFNRNSIKCYHYEERSNIIDAYKVEESDNKAYVKCLGINE